MTNPNHGLNPDAVDWDELEAIVRRDPAGRGLASYRNAAAPRGLGYGALQRAAEELAARAKRVAIVTGFCIVDANPPAAETDGPPGALYLARALADCGIDIVLMSDVYAVPLLRAGAAWFDLDNVKPATVEIVEWPGVVREPSDQMNMAERNAAAHTAFASDFLAAEQLRGLTHLISTERVGPSHTLSSIADQGAEIATQFERETPQEDRNVCHNMRGRNIDDFTAPIHELFDLVATQRAPISTIGIGDGGNEIGMGSFAWQTLREAVRTGPAAITACRIAADHAVVAGVSDWGAYALALATVALRCGPAIAAEWNVAGQRHLIERLVEAGAVDGVSKQRVASVDGLAMDEYLQPLADMRKLFGLQP